MSTSQTQPEGSTAGAMETASGSQVQKELMYVDIHNIRAYLEKGKVTRDCYGMIDYMKRSRIHKAISARCSAYLSHQRDFWKTAVYDSEANVIKAVINKQDVLVSEAVLNVLLGFGDAPGDPILLSSCRVKGCLLRCGYNGKVEVDTIKKTLFCPPYRYLMHILSHCLGSRRSGHDQINTTFSHLFVSLILNVPFNISKVIFKAIKGNMSKGKDQFLLYPRFLQMVIDSQMTNLVKEDGDKMQLKHMSASTVGQMSRYIGEHPPKRKLICHLANPQYKAPVKKHLWRNTDSNSGVENMQIVSDDEEEVESVELNPTQGENIPGNLGNVLYDDILESEDILAEETLQRRVGEDRGKEVTEESQRKKRKVFKYKPLIQPTTQAAPTSGSSTPATTITLAGSQLPPVSATQELQLVTRHVMTLLAKETEREAREKQKDEELEKMKSLLDESARRDAEREQLLKQLQLENEDNKKVILELKEENQSMRTMVLEHNKKIEQLEDDVLLKLKVTAEEDTYVLSDEEEG